MKLSDLDASEVTAAPNSGIRLSDIHPDDVTSADDVPLPASEAAGMISSIPFAPQVSAAGKTAMDVITGGTDIGDALPQYRRERNSLQSDLANKVAAHPLVALAGSLPAMGALPLGANAESMAAYGAASGLSNSKADLTQGEVGPALDDALKGGAVGGVLGGAAETASPYLEKAYSKLSAPVANYLKELADKKFIASTGATGKQAAQFAANAPQLLRKFVGFGDSQPAIAEKISNALENSGKGIGDSIAQLDAQGVNVSRPDLIASLRQRAAKLGEDDSQLGTAKSLNTLADNLEQKSQQRMAGVNNKPWQQPAPAPEVFPSSGVQEQMPLPVTNAPAYGMNTEQGSLPSFGDMTVQDAAPTGQALGENASTPLDSAQPSLPLPAAPLAQDTMPLSQAEIAKRGFQDGVNYNDTGATTSVAEQAADVYRQSVEDAATKADPAIAQKFKDDKELYGLLKPIDKAATARSWTTSQSPPGGLLDVAAASVGGAPAAIARRAIAPRVNSSIAVGSDWLADTIRTAPQSLGKWAPSLTAAAARGGSAVGATDFLLQQTDPAYREHLMGLKNASQEVADQQGDQ